MNRCSDKHLPTITMERPSMVHSNCIVRGKSAVNMRKRKVDVPANVDHEALSCSVHLWFPLFALFLFWPLIPSRRLKKYQMLWSRRYFTPLLKSSHFSILIRIFSEIEGTPLAYQWVIRRVIQGQIRCCCQNVVFTPRTDYRFWHYGVIENRMYYWDRFHGGENQFLKIMKSKSLSTDRK